MSSQEKNVGAIKFRNALEQSLWLRALSRNDHLDADLAAQRADEAILRHRVDVRNRRILDVIDVTGYVNTTDASRLLGVSVTRAKELLERSRIDGFTYVTMERTTQLRRVYRRKQESGSCTIERRLEQAIALPSK